METTSSAERPSDEQVAKRLAFADAGLALAGHEISRPEDRELLRRVAAEELTAAEATEILRQRILAERKRPA